MNCKILGRLSPYRFLVIAAFLAALVLPLTYQLAAYRRTPPGFQYTALGEDDEYSYFSWMKQAAEGKFFFRDLYAFEEHRPLYFNPFFYLLGVFSKVSRLDFSQTMVLARVFFGALLLIFSYAFACLCFRSKWERFGAFLVIAFSSGLGSLAFVPPFNTLPATELFRLKVVSTTEVFTFSQIALFPHFTFSVLTFFLSLLLYLRAVENHSRPRFFLAVLAANFLFSVHPYSAVVFWPVLFLVNLWPRSELNQWRCWRRFFLFSLLTAPVPFYFFAAAKIEPVFGAWSKIKLPPLSLFNLLFFYGFLLAGLLFSTALILKRKKGNNPYLVLCLIVSWVTVISSQLPLNFSRKLLENLPLPLSILYAFSLFELRILLRGRKLPNFLISVLLILMFLVTLPQNAFFLWGRILSLPRESIYLPTVTVEALRWLDTSPFCRDGSVFSSPPDGLVIPGFTGRTVFVGHVFNTPHYDDKLNAAKIFFSGRLGAAEKIKFLKQARIACLFFDKSDPLQNPAFLDGLRLRKLFENSEIVIYKVKNNV